MWEPSGAVSSLPRGYAFVLVAVVHNWMVLMWQALKVGTARRQYGVKYPSLYEAKEDSQFNLVQRAHQNSLEWNPGFLVFLLAGGVCAPLTSAAAGFIYNYGRIAYARGYYAGSPHKGLWGLFALFYLLGTTCYTAFRIFAQ
jgi:glutathione S-transferase